MKKIVSMLLILAISFSLCTAYANTEKTDVSKQAEIVNTLNEGNVYTLSLEEAKKLAYTDNRQIAAVELKKHSYDLSVDSARLNKKAMKYNEYNNVSSSTAGVLVRKGYYVELYRSQSELAKKELEKVKAKIDYDVTEKYYNYKLTERLVEVCKTSYELAKTNLEVVKKQFDLGLAAQIDIDSASAVCEQAKAAAENYERTLDIVEENLKISLNIEGPAKFVLTDGIDYVEYKSNIDEDINKAMETRYDIKGLKESARLAEMNYTIISNALTDRAAEALSAKSNFVQADYSLENNTKLIKLGIRSAYNAIITADSDMAIAKINIDINTQKYNAAKLQYEMGMITNSQLTTILNDLRASEISYEQARLSHKLAVEKYGYEITIGL